MATYYVKPTGNDLAAGTSEATAFATVTKALTVVAAGDTVYIAPGTYRNTSGWTLATPGAAGSIITIAGDPDCVQFANENPGYVRLTGCDATELPSRAGAVFTALQNYIHITGLVIDGTTGTGNHDGLNIGTGTSRAVSRCIISGSRYGVNGAAGAAATVSDCIVSGGYYGANLVTITRSVVLGGYAGTASCAASFCIATGGTGCFAAGTASHCASIGGNPGFSNVTATNCIAIGGRGGFTCTAATTVTNCHADGCYIGFGGAATPNELTVVDCINTYCTTAGSNLIGAVAETKHVGTVGLDALALIARVFRPDQNFAVGLGTGAGAATDILGLPAPLYSSVHTPGPWATSLVTPDYTNYRNRAPGVRIARAGIHDFSMWARKNQTVTASIWVKWSGAGTKPRLAIVEDATVRDSDTATGTGADWEELQVSFTATRNCKLQVWAQAQDDGAASYAIFSDPVIG